MRTWTRNAGDKHFCGGCGRDLPKGTPIQLITPDPSRGLLGVKWVRCVFCAEGMPPEDLPPLVSKTIPIVPSVLIPSGPGTLPLDFKSAAAGREPGEDD